jgi:carbon-monoxide dehydrogenase large subunit
MAKPTSGARWQPRVEDDPLLRGRGRFAADAASPGQCFGYFVRSPHAFARIREVDVDAARRAPGVLAVLTSADMAEAGVGNISRHPPMPGKGGKTLMNPHRPSLARERVLHVGEPVALVVAQSLGAAQDAAELVAVGYEELQPVIGLETALAPGAPQLWPDAPGNLALHWPGPLPDDGSNAREVELILSAAHRVARTTVAQQRLVVASMEPRGATAFYDPATDKYLLRAGSQSAGTLHDQLAGVMGFEPGRLRVVSEDVGGAFGMKTPVYPEYPALLVAVRKLGRPVHWMASRSEAFQSDNQGRDSVSEAELALDRDGRFLALRVRHLQNLGAYVGSVGAFLATNNFARCLPGMYAIPRIDIEVRCVFTNTVPTGPYRGAGRPEANYLLERLVDEAARVSGLDRVEIRRRNFIPPSAMPHKTAMGATYDSGEFETILDQALKLADYAGFAKRRDRSVRAGKLRGIGISCFLEHSGGLPGEGASITFPGGNKLVLGLGVHPTGQGHHTVFGRLVADRLAIDPAEVEVRQGDSDFRLKTYSSVASRSAMTAGNAAARAADAMLAKGRAAAAILLEAADSDVVYRDGAFEVVGTNRRMLLFEVAERAKDLLARGKLAETLDTRLDTDTPQTFPNGCHLAEVEIDPSTGVAEIVGYAAVDDCGNVLDHVIVEAQVQGGVAQGVGQALLEAAVYDPGTGQLLTGAFTDYAMPRADEVPDVVGDLYPVPARTNALGVKGVGEAGTTASLAAIMNALADAIPGEAGKKLDMPATPQKIWRACREGRSSR